MQSSSFTFLMIFLTKFLMAEGLGQRYAYLRDQLYTTDFKGH